MMEKIKIFYQGLTQKQKITFWIAIGIIVLSFFRVVIWKSSRRNIPKPGKYIKQMKSTNEDEKLSAIYGAGVARMKKSVSVLEEILKKDPDIKTKRVAAWSLGKIDKNKLVEFTESQNKEVKSVAIETLMKLDKNNISYLLEKFSSQDTRTQFKILSYIQSFQDKKYEEDMMGIAENSDEQVAIRKRCLEILGDIGTLEIESRLWNLYYNDEEEEIKSLAEKTIQRLKIKNEK